MHFGIRYINTLYQNWLIAVDFNRKSPNPSHQRPSGQTQSCIWLEGTRTTFCGMSSSSGQVPAIRPLKAHVVADPYPINSEYSHRILLYLNMTLYSESSFSSYKSSSLQSSFPSLLVQSIHLSQINLHRWMRFLVPG